LSLVLKQTLDLMGAEVCIIWLRDSSGSLIPRMSFGLKTDIIQSIKLDSANGLAGTMTAKDGPFCVNDISGIAPSPLTRLFRDEGLKSLLAAPLIAAGRKIGLLMVLAGCAAKFKNAELKVFDAISKQAALAIADIGLYERTDRKVKEKSREISTLSSLSRSLALTVDLNVLLDLILAKAQSLTKAEFCILRLFDNSRKRLRLASSVGIGKPGTELFVKFENSVAPNILENGICLKVDDVNAHFKDNPPICLKKHGVRSILMTPLFSSRRRVGTLSAYSRKPAAFGDEETEVFEMVAGLCSMAIDNRTMLSRIRQDYLSTIKTLAKIIDANDPYTRGHCDKVMRYSLEISKKMKLPPWQRNAIKTASLLHDIGKVGIDMTIIRKAGRLTPGDWKRVKTHPDIGAKILSQTGFLDKIVPIIRHHHERFGGGGYPEAERQGERIPLGARIIAVADAYDAMTSDRPYRKAMDREEAVRELKRCSWTQFDPKMVNAFLG
jgi:putative nucleotidyltransferase with HDIG domain